MKIQRILPNNCEEIRKQVFEGEIYLTPPSNSSRKLVDCIIQDMQVELGTNEIRKAHKELSDIKLFERIGNLRRHFYLEPAYHERLRNVVEDSGLDPKRIAFDPIRIRVVLPGGHRNLRAAPVYYPHRDTWYSHPQSLIVWWIPLHDLQPEETFEFYPTYFCKKVPNDSEIFNYNDWIKDGPALKIGWQKLNSGETANYPRALSAPDRSNSLGFSCNAAEQLIFAGAHFHKTLPQDLDTIRFSLDFRVVHLNDIKEQAGAPNVDNLSRGTTFIDYIQPN